MLIIRICLSECLILVTILIVLISWCCIRIIYGSNDEPKCETRRWKMHWNDHSNKEKGENHMGRDRGKSRLILHQSYRGCCFFYCCLSLFRLSFLLFFSLVLLLFFHFGFHLFYIQFHTRTGSNRRWPSTMRSRDALNFVISQVKKVNAILDYQPNHIHQSGITWITCML